jgi:hypothetical protein
MFVIPSAVQARSTVPIVERENLPIVTGSGKPAGLESIKKAIRAGGLTRNWEIVPAANGKILQGTYTWNNNKHTIMVNIEPTTTEYSVRYANSINMKYEAINGQPVIHPHYNKFVNELIQSIRIELLKL